MTSVRSTTPSPSSAEAGLTLVEAVVSMVIVSVMLVAALNTVGISRVSQQKTGQQSRGVLLAQQLMAEILAQEYEEPDDTPEFGRESESGGDRTDYDDVDDYDGWDAEPPEYKDGSELPNLDGWERIVAVVWVQPTNLSQLSIADTQTKRITVTVTHDDLPVAELVALKTVGLPPPRVGPTLLFVVTDGGSPTDQESARQTLMESWGYTVMLISASAPQADFDAAVADVDVAYVSCDIIASNLGTKLRDASIGVVLEGSGLITYFGIAGSYTQQTNKTTIGIMAYLHYITWPVEVAPLSIFYSSAVSYAFKDTPAGANILARQSTSLVELLALDLGTTLTGGGTAAGRRVQLPWGATGFDMSLLTADGQTIMKRSIVWAAGMDLACGDSECVPGEDPCTCPDDCGVQTAFEEPGVNCTDRIDNDCDGGTDCVDLNCTADPVCLCGNSICDPGEDCNTCSEDCDAKTTGTPSLQYCCGNGILEPEEGDGSICDGNP